MAKSSQDKALLRIFGKYKGNAKRKGLNFSLTFSVFRKMVLQNCFYCGATPSGILKRHNVLSLFNGIDRLNNDYGYTTENSVTCCTHCNFLKGELGFSDFVKHVSSISLHLLGYKKRS